MSQLRSRSFKKATSLRSVLPPLPSEAPNVENWKTRKCGNIYSEAEVSKMILDYLREVCNIAPLKEDHFFTYSHIAFSSFACLAGLYASVGITFPQHSFRLLGCVIAHFLCLIGWFCVEYFFLYGAAITFWTVDNRRNFLNLTFDRQTANMTLELHRYKPYKISKSCTRYLGKYFYSTGELICENVFNDFAYLYAELATQQEKQTLSSKQTDQTGINGDETSQGRKKGRKEQ